MSNERTQLQNVLLDFQQLFQGKHGEYNGEPLSLDLLPNSSKWAVPIFIIPKETETVQVIMDFCGLNKCLK